MKHLKEMLHAVEFKAMRKAWPVHAQDIATHFAHSLSVNEARLITQSMTRMLDALG